MPTDYEKEWPKLRVEWARKKINDWSKDLEKDDLPVLTRKTLEHDLELMSHALKDWESRA